MKLWLQFLALPGALLAGATQALAVEEAPFTVVERSNAFEIRDYQAQILAETVVEGAFDQAGDRAFNRLFRYISGDNESRKKVAMTAPVAQEPRAEKIAMTAPVSQVASGGHWAIGFVMPASYTLESLPAPKDPKVTLRQVPARRLAAVRYSGFWDEAGYRKHRVALEKWLESKGVKQIGEPVWARYDPPFKPWFMRRNEVLIPVEMPKRK